MNVILVNPPLKRYSQLPVQVEPLGLCYLAAELQRNGHRVTLYDLCTAPETLLALEQQVQSDSHALVGITALTEGYASAVRIAAFVKARCNAVVVLGGPHASSAYEAVLDPNIDYLAVGEGERTLRELVACLEEGGAPEEAGINGIVWKDGGRCVAAPRRDRITNLDELDFPDRNGLDIQRYVISFFRRPLFKRRRTLSISTTRGCPGSCYFCASPSIWGFPIRRSVGSVVAELQDGIARYGLTNLLFVDDDLISEREFVEALFEQMIQRRMGIHWMGFGRVRYIDEELARLMAASGCDMFQAGVETLDPEGSRLVGKPMELEQVIEAVRCLNRYRILPLLTFILGFPWDTRESIEASIRGSRKIPSVFVGSLFAEPYPGTRMFEDAVRENLLETGLPLVYQHAKPLMHSRHLSSAQIARLQRIHLVGQVVRPISVLRIAWMVIRDPAYLLILVRFVIHVLVNNLRFGRMKAGQCSDTEPVE